MRGVTRCCRADTGLCMAYYSQSSHVGLWLSVSRIGLLGKCSDTISNDIVRGFGQPLEPERWSLTCVG